MFLILFAHTVGVMNESAIRNPQDPERLVQSNIGSLLFGGMVVTVSFFVVGAFLFTLKWLSLAKEKQEMSTAEYMVLYIKFNVFRYVR